MVIGVRLCYERTLNALLALMGRVCHTARLRALLLRGVVDDWAVDMSCIILRQSSMCPRVANSWWDGDPGVSHCNVKLQAIEHMQTGTKEAIHERYTRIAIIICISPALDL